jgi:hypothetical protein
MSTEQQKMVELSDAELDAVAAGLVTVIANDVVDVNNNKVNANVGVNVLGNQGQVIKT